LFYPWGDVWEVQGSGGYNFANIPYRDVTTTTDITTARFSSPNLGRWFTPDPAGKGAVRLDDPQTWNMYAYVRNNPTTLTDPSGLLMLPLMSWAGPSGVPPGCGLPCIDVGYEEENGGEPPPPNPPASEKQQNGNQQPSPQPPPTTPDGRLKPPPVPVPGAPDLEWKYNPDPQNPRGGTWGPKGWKGPNPPSGSWDPAGHWDINGGKGEPVDHYDPKGNPITPGQAHPPNAPTRPPISISPDVARTAVKVGFWGTAAAITIRVLMTLGEAAAAF
jgi:RHS repeat-associated protein